MSNIDVYVWRDLYTHIAISLWVIGFAFVKVYDEKYVT